MARSPDAAQPPPRSFSPRLGETSLHLFLQEAPLQKGSSIQAAPSLSLSFPSVEQGDNNLPQS